MSLAIFYTKKMNRQQITLTKACAEAIQRVRRDEREFVDILDNGQVDEDVTVLTYPHYNTVMDWWRSFRENRENFINVHERRRIAEKYPPILDAFPDLREKIIIHAKENLSSLSVELIYTYIHEELLPDLLQTWQEL